MWNMLIRFYIEGYLELSMACFINFKNVSEQVSIDDNLNYWFAFGMIVSLLCFPFYVSWFVNRTNEEKMLHDIQLRSVFGSIYENLKLQRKRGVAYYAVFTLRRLLFAFNIAYMETLVYQI